MAPEGLGSDFQICFILSMSAYISNRSMIALMKMIPALCKIISLKSQPQKGIHSQVCRFGLALQTNESNLK